MKILFDDSLPTLCAVVAERLSLDALQEGVVLRDASGRLAFFSSHALNKTMVDVVSQALREALGPYARTDRIFAGADDFGAARVLQDPIALTITVGEYRIRLLDRRMVGADWLRAPADPAPPPPRIVFASLKGGVGRSTALAVAAVDLASRGLRVLAVDLDLEAPGLGPMLLNEGTLPEYGTLDALVENGLSALDNTFLSDLIGPSDLAAGRGRIDVMPVLGRRSLANPGEVLAKLSRAYTEVVGANGSVATFRDQVAELLDRVLARARYDIVVIDARAGLHESTAASLMGLGAEVLLFGLDEPQTFQGYRVLLAHLARFADPACQPPEWFARLTLVQGKAPPATAARQVFAERFRQIFKDAGLGPQPVVLPDVAPTAEPFSDPEWDDGLPDEAVLPAEDWEPGEVIAILDDTKYRGFDPRARRDLLEERLYEVTFGGFVEHVRAILPTVGGDPK